MKKILIGLGLVIGLLLIGGFAWVNTGLQLPENTEEIIEDVLSKPVKNLIVGDTATLQSDGVRIWYEFIPALDSAKGTILLVMGYSTSGLQWTQHFFDPLREAGYNIIRYDNRGVGRSDWMKDWDKSSPYTLEDMAGDGIAILDKLDIKQAHIIGASMGGMIAQRMAISYPERTFSLGSIMSSGFTADPELTMLTTSVQANVVKGAVRYGLRPSDKNFMRFNIAAAEVLRGDGPYEYDVRMIANQTHYQLRHHDGYNPAAGDQHGAAIEASGSRYDELGKISCPTVAIHGTADPLVLPEHGKKYQPMIPGSNMVWIEGMGHDLPRIYQPQVQEALLANIAKVL